MIKKTESGKVRVIKGSLIYLWEEIKTMNMGKMKALKKIVSGYFKMKYTDQKKQNRDFSLNGR